MKKSTVLLFIISAFFIGVIASMELQEETSEIDSVNNLETKVTKVAERAKDLTSKDSIEKVKTLMNEIKNDYLKLGGLSNDEKRDFIDENIEKVNDEISEEIADYETVQLDDSESIVDTGEVNKIEDKILTSEEEIFLDIQNVSDVDESKKVKSTVNDDLDRTSKIIEKSNSVINELDTLFDEKELNSKIKVVKDEEFSLDGLVDSVDNVDELDSRFDSRKEKVEDTSEDKVVLSTVVDNSITQELKLRFEKPRDQRKKEQAKKDLLRRIDDFVITEEVDKVKSKKKK